MRDEYIQKGNWIINFFFWGLNNNTLLVCNHRGSVYHGHEFDLIEKKNLRERQGSECIEKQIIMKLLS